jgi:uncharacterized protein
MSARSDAPTARLIDELRRYPSLAIAVSGGVDSLTLATVAHRAMSPAPLMVHAVSAAVPAAATERAREAAAAQGWSLKEIVAGEFDDANYLANPYNRCYHCKSNLYRSMRAITDRALASGTNVDDLSDFRPGLKAATERDVVHPFVNAGIGKDQIRAIARAEGLEYAELPAQPCLASRIETGIPIRGFDLRFVDELEARIRSMLGEQSTVRVRMRAGGVHVELGDWPHAAVQERVEAAARALCAERDYSFVALKPYRQGSAFVGPE